MAGIKVNEEGVQALRTLAAALPETVKTMEDATKQLEAAFEEKKEWLGPHTSDIDNIIQTVQEAQKTGNASIVKLQGRLVGAAAKLSEIISKTISVSGSGNP